jgi:uncharacterized protein YuzE
MIPPSAAARRERLLRSGSETKAMKLHVDKQADALYLRLDDSTIVESQEVSPGVVLDYNEQNQVVGVEMVNLSTRSTGLNLSALQFETTDKPESGVVG